MEEKDYLDLLAKREIQPTAIRILVLQAMLKAGRSVSLLDLEKILDTVDKSSIFRTITFSCPTILCTALTTGQALSNMQSAAPVAPARSTTCIPIFTVRDATKRSVSTTSPPR